MAKKIDHIGIAVQDIDAALKFFREKFEVEATWRGTGRGYHVAFLPTQGSAIELIQDVSPGGIITKFVEKRGEGVHHISFEVDDIKSALAKMQAQGVDCDKEPKEGARNTLVAFLRPKDTFGILIELVEFPNKRDK